MTLRWAVGVSLVALSAAACRGGPADDATRAAREVDLPGLDTRELTPREKRELSGYLGELPSPCATVAVPIAQCVLEHRPCPGCLAAASTVLDAVRQGLAREQVEALYKKRFDPTAARSIPVDGSPARGPAAPRVTVVEFADFECPFCQRIAPDLEELWEKRKTSVRFVYKFMPLSMHPHGEVSARAAIAAQSQGKFWEMHRLLFASAGRLEAADLDGYAKAIGLDLERLHRDMGSAATTARIEADRKLADALGVKGTPSIFINGREYDAKIDMDEWVDSEIAAPASPR